MRKNCCSDQEKLLKFEAEFAKILRSLEQFIQTVRGQNFWRFLISNDKLERLELKLENKYWDLETCRKS